MKNIIFTLCLILLVSGCNSSYQKLYNAKPAQYAYIMGETENDNIIFEHAADIYVTPASCQKVITALLALKVLGPDFVWETKLLANKKHKKIQNIVISFSGDPLLTSQQLIRLLTPIKDTNIPGQIIIDASAYNLPEHSPNIMIDDIGTSYAQSVPAVNIDKNLIKIIASPNKNTLVADIASDSDYDFDSEIISTSDDKTSINIDWQDEGHIIAKGKMNEHVDVVEKEFSSKKHNAFITIKLKSLLDQLNIQGKIVVIKDKKLLPKNLSLISQIQSKKLEYFLPPALKKSDNLVFDSLYLKLIHSQAIEEVQKWRDGNPIYKNLIAEQMGVNTKSALFVDGSGMSRYNRIQPRTLYEILKFGSDNLVFLNALARSGEEQTSLEDRENLSPNIIAKTGSMSGVACLCGYARGKDSKAFVMMVNDFAPPSKEIYQNIDQFISQKIN